MNNLVTYNGRHLKGKYIEGKFKTALTVTGEPFITSAMIFRTGSQVGVWELISINYKIITYAYFL